jgi:hypothetical protein
LGDGRAIAQGWEIKPVHLAVKRWGMTPIPVEQMVIAVLRSSIRFMQ